VRIVLAHAETAIEPYRASLFDEHPEAPADMKSSGWLGRIRRAVFSRHVQPQVIA
jgi:hypothetical protein